MWVCRGGAPEKPGLLYHYAPSRGTAVAKELVAGYRGIVQSDGYKGYDFLDEVKEVVHAGCWAHVRRKFKDAEKGRGKVKKPGSVEVALSYIKRLYALEKEAKRREITGHQLLDLRREKAKPLVADFLKWLSKKNMQVPPKSLLGTAVSYTLNQWPRLMEYLDHAELTLDNNLAENAIRPFVIGRKNWLFAGTVEGAQASAGLYSLIETAKACGLEPYHYLRFIFEKLPFAETREDYLRLMPASLSPGDLALETTSSGV